MTQMLLFDSPANVADSTLVSVSEPVSGNANLSGQEVVDEPNVAAQLQQDSGLHHMGDLARLVLLRYDLMAKRRAEMAARRQARANGHA